MLNLFKQKQRRLLGVDISSSSVKILELSHDGNQYTVEYFGTAQFPSSAVIEKDIRDVDAVAKAIRKAHVNSKSSTRAAAVAVAGSSVITKVIQMDADLLDHEIEAQIYGEADRYISYPIEEMNIDFEVLGVNEFDPHLVDILIAAARTENVNAHISALHQANLQPRIVGIEVYAIERAYQLLSNKPADQNDSATSAIIDIGDEMSTITVLHAGNTIYMRDELFGGHQLTDMIMQHYRLTQSEAEKLKLSNEHPKDYQQAVLLPFKEELLQQIHRGLQFFNTSEQHRSIDAVFIAGGCANIPNIARAVAEKINTRTEIANPILDLPVHPRINKNSLIKYGPQLLIACGLAMRAFTDATY